MPRDSRIGRWIESARSYAGIVHGVQRVSRRPIHQVIHTLAIFRLRYGGNPRFFADAGLVDVHPSHYGDYVDDAAVIPLQRQTTVPHWRYLEENKLAFAARCAEAGLPTGEILGVIVTDASEVTPWQGAVARSADELHSMLRGIGDAAVIIKLVYGGLGYGVHGATIRHGIPRMDGQLFDAGALLPWLAAQHRSPSLWLIQRRIPPHAGLHELMPGPGLGTVRIHSFLGADDGVAIRWAHLKIPGAGQTTDNFRDGGGTTAIASIDLASGRLRHCVGRRDPSDVLRPSDVHPVSGARVADVQLPDWEALLTLVRRAALAFPELPALGWDVALTPAGPIIIEANWQFGVTGIQIAHRIGVRRELGALLARVTAPRASASGLE
ncbi:MAG: sugar-transfer associated ATP-grasp domain-containing protein [Gemmatimonadota bacterium]